MTTFNRVPSRVIKGDNPIYVFDADQNITNSGADFINSFGEE
nr:hypothetical protein [Pedobacter schmidteae]